MPSANGSDVEHLRRWTVGDERVELRIENLFAGHL
nr:MAG TPA: hypothetical protein [Caudoviricetes sp.]